MISCYLTLTHNGNQALENKNDDDDDNNNNNNNNNDDDDDNIIIITGCACGVATPVTALYC